MQTQHGKFKKYYDLWFSGHIPSYIYAPSEREINKINLSEGEDNQIDLSSEVGVERANELGVGFTIITGFKIDAFTKND